MKSKTKFILLSALLTAEFLFVTVATVFALLSPQNIIAGSACLIINSVIMIALTAAWAHTFFDMQKASERSAENEREE
ncbi:MAG: hypothetical protein ACLSUT_04460 [Christensenellales bacterium]|jgi:hypothetical protein